MNQQLSNIELIIQQSALSDGEKQKLLKEISNADNQWNIPEFKPDRTEKVKETTAILLEETIEELEQKRKVVEVQNRELEIEAALERVRAVAMAMKEPADMLEICRTISHQLALLNVKEIRNVQTAIFYESTGNYMNYEYYAKHDKTFITETSYTNHETHRAFAAQMLKGKGEFFTTHINKDELADWLAYQKTTNVFIDTFLETANSLTYYWYSLGPVALGISAYEPLKEEDINLFKRFLKVFALSYTRYLDIEQAIAQARESQIQLALERVRARTMAMQKSDELSDAVYVLFQQFKELGENPDQATIGMINEDEKVIEYWVTMYGQPINKVFKFSIDEPNVTNKIYNAWKENKKSLVIDLGGNALTEFMAYRASKGGAAVKPDEKRRIINVAFFSKGLLNVQSNEERPEESIKLLERFASVFEQTYTRFLDLKNAEAQAREAQIEAALERVRSRSLAMHRSDELREVVAIVFEKLRGFINTAFDGVSILIPIEGSKDLIEWVAAEGKTYPEYFRTPYISNPVISDLITARQSGVDFFKRVFDFEEKNTLWKYTFENSGYKDLPEDMKKRILESESYAYCVAFEKNSALVVASISGQILSEKETEILKRFAHAFEQAYVRFLDLQKAEAQARESEIQLALERVRARTMAMQKSDELGEAASLLFQQVKTLGIGSYASGFTIWENDDQDLVSWMCNADGSVNPPFKMPPGEIEWHRQQYRSWKKKEDYIIHDFTGKEMQDHYRYLRSFPLLDEAFKKSEAAGVATPERQVHNAFNFSHGNLLFITLQPVPEAHDIFKRFAKVFEQTYIRFLDLHKAEEQAREAQIQLALERVRARTMAMQKSEELSETASLLFDQVQSFGVALWSCGINIWEKGEKECTSIITRGGKILPPVKLSLTENPSMRLIYEFREKEVDFWYQEMYDEEIKELFTYIAAQRKKNNTNDNQFLTGVTLPFFQIVHFVNFSHGNLMFITLEAHPEMHDVFKRLGNVFEQTYTRFLDLQKAEAQARESQIQLALERVRARTMAMQKSGELTEVAELLFKQVSQLGIKAWTTGFNVWSEDNNSYEDYVTNPEGGFVEPYTVDTTRFSVFAELGAAKKRAEEFFVQYADGETLREVYRQLKKSGEKQFERISKDGFEYPSHQVAHFVFGSKVSLLFVTYEPVPEAHDIFKRFGKVFEQTYTRFLDLQKAEEQARESQIQLALERVRARTMAMQHSDELSETAYILFHQFRQLGDIPIQITIGIFNEEKNTIEFRIIGWDGTGLQIDHAFTMHIDKSGLLKQFYKAWKEQKPSTVIELTGQELLDWVSYRNVVAGSFFSMTEKISLNDHRFISAAFFAKGLISFSKSESIEKETIHILERFAGVFDQTYIRFLDLQKAEAQAREAQIQLALERVRSKTTSMHSSNDVGEAVVTLYDEVEKLKTEAATCGIAIIHDNEKMELWTATTTTATAAPGEERQLHTGILNISMHPYFVASVDAWKNQQSNFSYELEGDSLVAFFKSINDATDYTGSFDIAALPCKIFNNLFFFREGVLFVGSEKRLSAASLQIFTQFASVFGQTYRRYLDLQKAEAQAREAQIEAALERVRSRTLAMQKSDELAETAAVLFRQLIHLGIEPNRLYINIIKNETGDAEFWITDEDGSKVSMAYEDNMNNNPSFKKMFEGWKEQKKSLVIDMKGKELKDYFKYLNNIHVPFKGGLAQKRRLQHIAYFNKGFIGMASPDEQPEATMQLLERFAYVFNLTFTRFNDLQIAEAHALQAGQDLIEIKAARKKAEDALSELQLTQRQLIQSEKMASLGELTAGIAHEIQNPLNFVNNFSEINKELIEELKGERQKAGSGRDAALEDEILNDIEQNLEKINYHGKRADSIVKGMLQHSRTSTGIKQPTDINKLADEYLRLAYHGLRAKDKSFNAEIKTEFDDAIGKINVVPQDIGRVLLNLFNNAFYVVNVKEKTADENYQPTISVVTKRINSPLGAGRIEMRVLDNGNGIPQNIVDKIFQPFFTTKPTGQGTGLGLSLAYDIIKAHGGEIKVETREGGGSAFVIVLPV